MPVRVSRRTVLRSGSLAAASWCVTTASLRARTMADETKAASDRPLVGAIGVGGRGRGIATQAASLGQVVAICDVDANHARQAREDKRLGRGQADVVADYRRLLDRKDVELVTIGTPDHWHTRICLDALRAGKDVYCEKPLTLTIDEGKLLRRAVEETGRVLMVGTQQRTEYKQMFVTAVGLCRAGRIGKLRRITCAIGGAPKGGPFPAAAVPPSLDWNEWLGQAPEAEFRVQRAHNNFRWWYEYSGGKMTDWGAHHVDIAHWAAGFDGTGPTTVEVVSASHPVPLTHGQPTADDAFNTATEFHVRCRFAGGVEIVIRDRADDLGFDNGILFEGESGRFFVNRGKLTGAPVEALEKDPLPEALLSELRRGQPIEGHMQHFFRSVRDRSQPISDVASHHRSLTTCHLANIAMRLGRTLTWDPAAEQIVGDDEARAMQSRAARKGFEVA